MRMDKSNIDILKEIVREIVNTRDVEIGCDDCFDQLDKFVDLELNGKSPEEAFPLVKDHIDRCKECREEYEALLEAIQSLQIYS